MTAVVGLEAICAVQVVIGVDTHQDEHVAVAIDQQGVRIAERHAPASSYGYRELERWSRNLGEVRAFGVEGTGSYGAGLARFLSSRGFTVVEVNRPDRSTRYRKGKSDPTDAEMAARAVLAGVANAIPKSGQGEIEMIRMLKKSKDSALKARTQAVNQMKALIVTAPPNFAKAWMASPQMPSPPVARASALAPLTIPRRPPSTLFAPLPVAASSSARRSAAWRTSWTDSPGGWRRPW